MYVLRRYSLSIGIAKINNKSQGIYKSIGINFYWKPSTTWLWSLLNSDKSKRIKIITTKMYHNNFKLKSLYPINYIVCYRGHPFVHENPKEKGPLNFFPRFVIFWTTFPILIRNTIYYEHLKKKNFGPAFLDWWPTNSFTFLLVYYDIDMNMKFKFPKKRLKVSN